jgi:hypothetical protein
MKQLYFLLILTLSFGVYSQGVFTYNFDVTTGGVFFKTALHPGDSTWGGVSSANGGAANQTPAAAGYMGVIGVAATTDNGAEAPGCVLIPGSKLPNSNNGSTNIYTQRYPNTATTTNNGASRDPAKSLGLSTGKVHFSIALKGWNLTTTSNNKLTFKFRDDSANVVAALTLRENPNSAGQAQLIGNVYNATANGEQKSAGHFGANSLVSTTPVVLGITIDFDLDTWEFWATEPGSVAGFTYSAYAARTGTFGATGTNTTSIAGVTVDHLTIVVQRPAGGTGSAVGTVGTADYWLLDQLKIHAPNYVDTVNYTASVDEFMQSSFSVYPNPADNYIVLQNAKVGDKVDLFDVVGKKVKSFNVESEIQQMDISELKTGVYFARSNQQEAIKIIKR